MTGKLLTTGAAVAGVATGIVEGNVALIVAVLVVLVPVRAAQGFGDALYVICRTKTLERMGVADPQRQSGPDGGQRGSPASTQPLDLREPGGVCTGVL